MKRPSAPGKSPGRATAQQKLEEAELLRQLSARALDVINPNDPDAVQKAKEALAMQNAAVDAMAKAVYVLEKIAAAEKTNEAKRAEHEEIRAFHAAELLSSKKPHEATGATATKFSLSKSQVRKIVSAEE